MMPIAPARRTTAGLPAGHNLFYGHGQINALKAVTRSDDD